jgi:glucosamine--fructose-6-phosphate aminotransferase (isomerizing)
MCGIFAYRGGLNASQVVFQGLRDLQYRGYDSWGIASIGTSGLKIKKNIGALPEKIAGLGTSNLAFGHTRWATHGGVLVKNSHPHVSCDQRFVVVHNGIIENLAEIKSNLKSIHTFTSDTDTEVIVHYLEEQASHLSVSKSLKNLISRIKGHSAFVVLDCETETLYAYRSGSPLVLGKRKDELFVSSDLPSLAPQVDQIYPLSDGELLDLSEDLANLKWLTPPKVKLDKAKLVTRYHMESEMYETVGILKKIAASDPTQYDGIAKRIVQARHLILTGCGSSYHACLYGQFLFAQLGIIAHPVIASEGMATLPTVSRDTVIIVLSQSGETIDTLDYVQSAKSRGAYVIALTNVRHSTLDRLSDVGLNLEVGVEVAVASTKAFIFMQMFFVRLAATLSGGSLSSGYRAYADALSTLYHEESKTMAKKLARTLKPYSHLFVVSRGDLLSLGYEAALKFKEIGYLHAESIISGELKHGPLALINEKSMCLVIKRDDSHDLDHTIAEVKARKGRVMEISLPELGPFTPLYGANLLHLVSFYHSLALGHNPDRPRNLAKSVTVK